jgi:hypothetical protein
MMPLIVSADPQLLDTRATVLWVEVGDRSCVSGVKKASRERALENPLLTSDVRLRPAGHHPDPQRTQSHEEDAYSRMTGGKVRRLGISAM